jgi:hypothetical protein
MEAQPWYLHPIQPDTNETSSFKHEVLDAKKLGEVGFPPHVLSSTPEKSDSSMTGTCQVIIEANFYIFDNMWSSSHPNPLSPSPNTLKSVRYDPPRIHVHTETRRPVTVGLGRSTVPIFKRIDSHILPKSLYR